jgi:pimeloyl-ACP methyl ester carboxylesterase
MTRLVLLLLPLVSCILLLPFVNAETVKVDDITMKYNKVGSGESIILISGWGNPLDYWPQELIQKLSEKYTVITFDNRGIGNSTTGTKSFTIKQFAQDTYLLMNKLNITKTHVLGYSMGGMIAQELVLAHPEKVNKLILQSTHCGQNQIPPSTEVMNILADASLTGTQKKAKLQPVLFPTGYNFSSLPKSSEIVTDSAISKQQSAITGWKGTCDVLKNISKDTMAIVGKTDNFTPAGNTATMASKIKNSWSIYLNGGHPIGFTSDKFTDSVLFFLD